MIKRVVLIVAIMIPVIAFSQNQPNESEYKNELKFGVGAAAGFSTAYGLSFRYWPAKLGIQLTTAPYISKYDTQISFGATVLNTIKQDDRIRLFIYFGNHILYEKWDYSYDIYSNSDISKYTTWIMGAGPGFEFTILRKMSFNLMFGLASYSNFNANNENDWMLNMTAETGLYYKF